MQLKRTCGCTGLIIDAQWVTQQVFLQVRLLLLNVLTDLQGKGRRRIGMRCQTALKVEGAANAAPRCMRL